jgi:hypothetical protein
VAGETTTVLVGPRAAAARPGGPVMPTASAIAAQPPLAAPGARLTGGLPHDWQRRNASASMPLAVRQLEAAGNMANLRLAVGADARVPDSAGRGQSTIPQSTVTPRPGSGYHGPAFMDSGIYKTLEAIGWELGSGPEPAFSVTDVAVETGDDELLTSSIRRWADMVATKTYLTGGNGSRHHDEGFGDRFELPPDRAYNETCAAIASFQWSWRLLLATGHAKYADHMERVLYNGCAAAISVAGDRFFYVNPLQRREDHYEKDEPGRRRIWFSCACCPPNIVRLLASVQHYLATTAGDTLYVQQYAGARLSGADLAIEIDTGYPWSGLVTIRVLGAPQGTRGHGRRYRLHDPGDRRRPAHLRRDGRRPRPARAGGARRRDSVLPVGQPGTRHDAGLDPR